MAGVVMALIELSIPVQGIRKFQKLLIQKITM